MKCPKCGYLGFEHVDRCRNCGYEFSLASPASETFELPLKPAPASLPVEDLSFLDDTIVARTAGTSEPKTLEALRPLPSDRAPESSEAELPLFGTPIPDDQPLISRPSPPRAPLSVRRATPEVPRLRNAPPRAPTLDLGFDGPERPRSSHRVHSAPVDSRVSEVDPVGEDASVAARLAAVVTDLLILAGVDVIVIYFTLRICGIGVDDLAVLPLAPLVAFLLVQNGGYLVAFTASGQTLGKMMAGIRVVSAEPRSPLDLGRAFVRELIWLALAVPAGLGLLTVLSRDRRGVHDRFAGTRVIRASAS
jgi:uncharacterized RDD family membrane protein YckC